MSHLANSKFRQTSRLFILFRYLSLIWQPSQVVQGGDYVYDLVGNRVRKDEDGTPAVYYFYNDFDQLDKETSDIDGLNILVSYLYDDNGSLTQKDDGTVTAYTYNLQNRLDSVTVGANPTITYTYNPDGIRVKADDGTTTTDYLIDPYNHTGYAQVFRQTQTAWGPKIYSCCELYLHNTI